ncbi:MAG: SRPBCC family protein [Caldilineaceae bacterium]|nr:SRPBCC family protein [Caldilineaceae bacterium]MCB9136909.1 SRPBCC family protein [Caldilineaceae bacterium]
MAEPVFTVSSKRQIQAAPGAVWDTLTRLRDWPRWNEEVLSAAWVEGEPWREGSSFELRHRSLFNAVTTTRATLRMVALNSTAVWESSAGGLIAVHSFTLRNSLGGTLLTARHAYHGWPAYGLRLLAARQQAKLDGAMDALQEFVEGEPRR